MDDIFGWHGNFIKSCSIRKYSQIVMYIIWKRMPPREHEKQTSTLQTFAFIMNRDVWEFFFVLEGGIKNKKIQ